MEANLLANLRTALARSGFSEFTRPFELNLVGVRNPTARAGEFADELHAYYADEAGAVTYAVLPCTTDPVTWAGWSREPAARALPLLAHGQYRDVLDVCPLPGQAGRLHLHQVGVMGFLEGYDRNAPLGLSVGQSVLRAGDEDHRLCFAPAIAAAVTEALRAGQVGYAGLARVQAWQILRNRRDYEWLLAVATHHVGRYGPLTYTLLDARTRRANQLRQVGRTALWGARLAGVVLGALLSPSRSLPDDDPEQQPAP